MLWISIVTQLSANLLFAWIQFSFYNEQMNRCVFRYKSMKSVKIKITRWINERFIDFCWLINTIGINQIRFTYFYRDESRIFFRRGCTDLLLYFNTNKPHSFFFLQNTSCIRKPQVISGRGATHPLHPPPRSAPVLSLLTTARLTWNEPF